MPSRVLLHCEPGERIPRRELSCERRARKRAAQRIGVIHSAAQRAVRRLHQLQSVVEGQQLLHPGLARAEFP